MGHNSTPLPRHFCRLMKNIGSFSNDQAKVIDQNDQIDEFTVEIIPNDGYYRGGSFEFLIRPENYPQQAPSVTCLTHVYHPNIDSGSSGDGVCLNLLDDWSDSNDLEDLVQGLLFLFYNPNLDDPLSPLFEPGTSEWGHGSFEENVRVSLEGGEIDDCQFERNLVDGYERTDDNCSTSERNTGQADTNENGKCKTELRDEEFYIVDIYFPDMSVVWVRVKPTCMITGNS